MHHGYQSQQGFRMGSLHMSLIYISVLDKTLFFFCIIQNTLYISKGKEKLDQGGDKYPVLSNLRISSAASLRTQYRDFHLC